MALKKAMFFIGIELKDIGWLIYNNILKKLILEEQLLDVNIKQLLMISFIGLH